MITISLEEKVVIVTGAAQGIGRAIAVKMAEAGCRGLVINDLEIGEKARETARLAEAHGAEVLLIGGDVSKEETVKKLLAEADKKWGRIDILINNAGIAKTTDLFTTSEKQWDLTLDVNLRSVFLGLKYGAEYMKEHGGGVILNMSSIAGITGGSTGPDYGASKAGVAALTKFAAKTLSRYGIRVNALAPGTIATDMIRNNYAVLDEETVKKRLATIPMGRMGEPEEVANAALFLVSDLSSYVNGEILMVTGGRMS